MSWLALTVVLLAGRPVLADTINVAVAANFTAPMRVLAEDFEQRTGHQLRLSFGSSGKIFAQLHHGAPFHVFLSADALKPTTLEEQGMIVPGSRFTYAIGTLALWSPHPSAVVGERTLVEHQRLDKLAIANPKLAPYGAAAMEVLQALKLEDTLRPKLVRGENIAQTYQFVASGNAQMGFVALSQLMFDGRLRQGSAWRVPVTMHSPIRQQGVILRSAADNPAAQALSQFLRSEHARQVIRSYGYLTH